MYINKSGKVFLYLGRDEQGRFIFYIVGALLIELEIRSNTYVVHNDTIEIKYLLQKTTEILQQPVEKDLLCITTVLTSLIYGFSYLTTEEIYKVLAKKSLLGQNTVKVVMGQDFGYIDNPQPIKAKDLQIGFVYVTKKDLGNNREGSPAYIYLGKTATGCYRYFMICLSGVAFNDGFEDEIQFYSRYDSHITVVKAPKTLYKPVYFKQYANVDTTPLLQKYKLIK